MTTKKGLGFFELVKYSTKSKSPTLRTSRERFVFSRRTYLRNRAYFFDRVVRRNKKDFESIHVRRELDRLIEGSIKKLVDKLRAKLEKIVPPHVHKMVDAFAPPADEFIDDITIDYEAPGEYYFYKHNSSVILPINVDSFCVLSRTRENATQLVQFIKSEFEKLNEVTKDFNLELSEFMSGQKYQEILLGSSENIQIVGSKKPRNKFEKEIIDFCESITSSFLPNLEISFTEPTETFEYDIFVGFTEEIKRIVEPTNYESVKDMPTGENLKSQIVLKTLDKAQRLGAKSVVIAKGFPENTFKELKKIANSRGVTLLNDANYKSALFRIFCYDLLEAYGVERPPAVVQE